MASRASSPRIGRWVAAALAGAGLTTAVASCGSRTGLFGPETGFGGPRADAAVEDAEEDVSTRCFPGRFTFELALTQLMFVVDRSGSMRFTLDGVQDAPRRQWRWTILQNALRQTITAFDDEIAMGAKFFPEVLSEFDLTDPERACRTDTGAGIAPARGNAASILNVFDTSEPRGGTPTSEAVRLAAQFLKARRSVASTIVLATDGAPNCNPDLEALTCICTSTFSCADTPNRGRFSCLDDGRTVATIHDVADKQKVPVYVIGIGSTERPDFLEVLDDMAIAGGRPRPVAPRHYNVQSEGELTSALAEIRDTVAKCTYLTPSSPNDPNKITISIDGEFIPRDQSKRNGWDWVNQSLGELAFFGEACAKARGATGTPAVVSGVVSCEE